MKKIKALKEQPVCDGLEEEIEMYFEDWDSNPNGAFFDKEGYKIGIIALKNIARHFAKWGAEHAKKDEIPVPADLEKAATEYAMDDFYNGYSSGSIIEDTMKNFKAGAKWGAEHLKK